jgi:hypothetical protein
MIGSQFFSDLGMLTSEDIAARWRQSKKLTEDLFSVADDIVSRNPQIID